uniref:Uncharacterized protein n=1 Tax=Meloidogyne enterolobii TaxID=390850 RepID=A0A6V7ULZ6_MELEN|nr:unnamed protein product [Meloidogyne enterolobii]
MGCEKGLAGRSSVGNYNFDGSVERGFVRGYRYVTSLGQVTNCNSFCMYHYGRGGACYSSYSNDCSSYCGCGQVCKC